jgi:hypothetical protein
MHTHLCAIIRTCLCTFIIHVRATVTFSDFIRSISSADMGPSCDRQIPTARAAPVQMWVNMHASVWTCNGVLSKCDYLSMGTKSRRALHF